MKDDFDILLNFKDAYLNNWDNLYIYAYNILQDKKVCEDIIQDIYLKLWRNREKLQEIDNLSGYLFQATRFQIYRRFRDKKVVLLDITSFNNLLHNNTTEEILNKCETETHINKCIEKLPLRCKEIFKLSRNENLAHKEIAKKLDISTQTVKNQISKALSQLRTNLEEVVS